MSPGRQRRVAAASVPGCQHVLALTPCQDAWAVRETDEYVVLALSDGHGDAAYPMSDEGARLASAVAVEVLSAVAQRLVKQPLQPEERDELAGSLKRNIAFEWNRRVQYHAQMVAACKGTSMLWPMGIKGEWDERQKPYGCTLLAAAITPGLTVWLQLGDGDQLAVDAAGARRVFPAADKSAGQATFSLSMRDCVQHMKVQFETEPRELYLLASDGVSDQYDVDPSFEDEWGTGMVARLRATGFVEQAMRLPKDLGQMARDGDDCSVVMAWFPPLEAGS